MAINTPFDPKTDGWFFNNFTDSLFSWDLFRQTYLAISPTPDPAAAPLDWQFYELVYKTIGNAGNCFGASLFGLALYKYGGFMGFCAPANFYAGALGPNRADLHEAINIMHARQLSAPCVRRVLEIVKAGQLNDAEAAYATIKHGLASGDYCVLSISNGLINGAGHTVIPYRVEEPTPGSKEIYIWDINRPYNGHKAYYDNGHNKLTFTSPYNWVFDEKYPGDSSFTTYMGSNGGWCFPFPLSLNLHKARQPLSVGFLLTELTFLFASGAATVTQIQDDDGRRLFATDTTHTDVGDIETNSLKRLEGVTCWPRFAAGGSDGPPGELFIVDRPPGSSPLTLTVRGSDYTVTKLHATNLVEINGRSAKPAKDHIRIDDASAVTHDVHVRSDGQRDVDIRHLRVDAAGRDWRSANITDARIGGAGIRLQSHGHLDAASVTTGTRAGKFKLELREYHAGRLSMESHGSSELVAIGTARQITPRWNSARS